MNRYNYIVKINTINELKALNRWAETRFHQTNTESEYIEMMSKYGDNVYKYACIRYTTENGLIMDDGYDRYKNYKLGGYMLNGNSELISAQAFLKLLENGTIRTNKKKSVEQNLPW